VKVRIPPRLDDRSFEQLRAEAVKRLQVACPGWTDLSASDPGIALVEAFAYLTEVMLYRLNRVPEKQYNAFLRLIGATQQAPAAATAMLRFSRSAPGTGEITIPQGTRVSAAGSLTFATTAPAVLRAGQDAVDALAFHGEQVEGEVAGRGTGAPGQEVTVRRPPIVARMSDGLELIVAVEADREEIPSGARAIEYDGKTFRVWEEVGSFGRGDPNACVYTADRLRGTIRFPPAVQIGDERGVLAPQGAALGAVPGIGREIRATYRVGGGAAGNVAAGTLTALQDRIAGLKVTNPEPASGGRDVESLDNAMLRGPIDFHRLHRAVTARDFEAVASQAGGVARAKALTKSEYWAYAPPGVVEILLVPAPGAGAAGPVSLERLQQWATEAERGKVQAALDVVRPLGTTCEVHWTRYKPVHVKLRAVTARQEDRASVQSRVVARLNQLVNPLPPTPLQEGWAYGGALRRYEVEGAVRAEPGVLYVSGVDLVPERLPDGAVATLAVDAFQQRTWYAGEGAALFRSLNAGDGWELLTEFKDETLKVVRANPLQAGLLVAVTVDQKHKSRVYLSADCGEAWRLIATTEFEVNDAAWSRRQGEPLLFLATDSGLYELLADGSSAPVQIEVSKKTKGFYAVVTTEFRGMAIVAASATEQAGVFLSRGAGATKSFARIDVAAKDWDVRVLAVQSDGVRSYLWAGLTIPGLDESAQGGGCVRYELLPDEPREGWQEFSGGWKGGSCRALAFTRAGVALAGTYWRGVLALEPGPNAAWQVPRLDAGLPLRDNDTAEPTAGRLLQAVNALAVDASTPAAANDRIAVATIRGVYRGVGPQDFYEAVSDRSRFGPELRECVTLPPTWLFVSGVHEVEVLSEDQAAGADAGH
jgi:hypothetical protein